MLIGLYEKCGDSIALQYAGSQLVHRVDTYGKNTLASQSRDMMHTISRYYSNAFADADKQSAINLFLGYFEPSQYTGGNIWDLQTDCYLHDNYIMQPWKMQKRYIEWIDRKLFDCLPMPYEQEFKNFTSFSHVEKIKDKFDPRISSYDNFYKPHELTAFHEVFYFSNLITNRISNTNTSGISGNIKAILDPFMLMRNAKKLALSGNAKDQNFKLVNSSDDESDDSFEVIPEIPYKINSIQEKNRINETLNENSSRFAITDISMEIYKNYVDNSKEFSKVNYKYLEKDASWTNFSQYSNITLPKSRKSSFNQFLTNKNFDPNNFFKIKFEEQTVSPSSLISAGCKEIYMNFLKIGSDGAQEPSVTSVKLYQEHEKQIQFSLIDSNLY